MTAIFCMAGGRIYAQNCGTDAYNQNYKAQHPEVAVYEQQLQQELLQSMKKINLNKFARTTNQNETTVYDVPVVFHIIHDYGNEYISDTVVYNVLERVNSVFAKTNFSELADIFPNYAGVIPGTTKDYVGKANIHFHLATIDPQGNPTHGITHRRSYLAYRGDDNCKFDQWTPASYANIWIVGSMAQISSEGGYTYGIPAANGNPYIDGIIQSYGYINVNNNLSHHFGHFLGLQHPFTSGGWCGDDGVDDTPPVGATGAVVNGCVFDTSCAHGYLKQYTYNEMMTLYGEIYPGLSFNPVDSTSLIDYPDTSNAQNIMLAYPCSKMFTYGQTQVMRAVLNGTMANRSNLISSSNLTVTGALAPWPDLQPVADFSLSRVTQSFADHVPADRVFGCMNDCTFTFTDRSWNDTIIDRQWTFSNGATSPVATTPTVTNKFSQPGWVDVTLTATGNGTGSSTITRKAVFVADTAAINPDGYFQEFRPGDISNWPMFNYYNNDFKWSASKYGVYDTTAICYNNFDPRIDNVYLLGTSELLGTPGGDYDDLFTPAFDLSGPQYTYNCNLNFMSASATRATVFSDMKDSLEIWYSIDCAQSWKVLKIFTQDLLHRQGMVATSYHPASPADWTFQSIDIPQNAKTSKTFFRFRYKPGVNSHGFGTGNNFYMDRFQINNVPTGVNAVTLETTGLTLAPNPTVGSTNLYVKGGSGQAQIRVTDITGKLVYCTQQVLNGNLATIEIPAASLAVKGMYLVQIIYNQQTHTEKLMVY
ncbi:T9SS type A sorting domain-containing protein [Taibaiella soli]|nr:T9SS type A sorting domain-containing protein [Taibaiella soli]